MKFRKLVLASAISSALLLAGCGGAGSESGSNSNSNTNTDSNTSSKTFSLTGVVVKGVISQGLVTAYELVNGAWVARGTATTDESGAYTIAIPAASYKGGIVKITLTSNAVTQMKCELSVCGSSTFGQFYSDTSNTLETLVSSGNINTTSTISNIPITPYTNLVASRVNALVSSNGTASQTDVATVAASIRSVVGFEPLTTKAVDITDSTAFNSATTLEQTAAIMSAAVAELAKTNNQDVSAVVANMAAAYADGVFNTSDTLQLSTLVQAWRDVQEDSSISTATASASAAVTAVDTQAETVTEALANGSGSYTPTPSADLATYLSEASDFYVAGGQGDAHLWFEHLASAGSNQYTFTDSGYHLTSLTTYTPESDYQRYVLTTNGWELLGDPDSVTLTPNSATGQLDGADNMGSFTMSGSCADISDKTFASQLSSFSNATLLADIDSTATFPSGSYACAVANSSNEPEISIQVWDSGTNQVSTSTTNQATTLADLFSSLTSVSGVATFSNVITNLNNGYQLALVGDDSLSQGEAVLLSYDSSAQTYTVAQDVVNSGWVKETVNGVTIIRIADAIRSHISGDINDGFYGFAEYDGRVQQLNYYLNTNEPLMFMNKTAYDAILAGHELDTDGDGYADTNDSAPTDYSVH